MHQNIDQAAVDDIREKLLRNLSFDPVDIADLIGWCAQPAPVVWAAILELQIAGLIIQHYGNRVIGSAPKQPTVASKNRQKF